MKPGKTAVIIGAGPAGLTAAYELLTRTDYSPIVIELDSQVGGLSKTVNYKGNRLDIGGHRFFTKSDRVEKWWFQFLKLQPDQMRLRTRLSRILFLGKLFTYPIELSAETLRNLGIFRSFKIVKSYLSEQLKPKVPVLNLEDFFVRRFGRTLYELFFESYTEKVWGVPCREIKPDWGAQRVKGLSISAAIWDMLTKKLRLKSLRKKNVETSLIESFFYPKHGPGQLWEAVAEAIKKRGGEIKLCSRLCRIELDPVRNKVRKIEYTVGNETHTLPVDLFISTMPIQDLVGAFHHPVPEQIARAAQGLRYRDFITIGILAKKNPSAPELSLSSLKDNWLYVQEPHVKVGRIQIFNNWSSDLVETKDAIWFGMEYFCQENDDFWNLPDADIAKFAIREVIELKLIEEGSALDFTVVRAPKAYPAYFGTYSELPLIQAYLDSIPNLYAIGRNGMHRYNNSDHSILTALVAVDEILKPESDKSKIWSVNVEQEYHEVKKH